MSKFLALGRRQDEALRLLLNNAPKDDYEIPKQVIQICT
jgi:hypothetical protein